MTEHEEEMRTLFERGSVEARLVENPNNARLMTFEGFKLVAEILMKKAEYFGRGYAFSNYEPTNRA